MASSDQPKSASSARSFQAPKGTRDLYPQDMLRRRYIEKAWRDTAIRHGFEEIDGPTFEYADLYAVKSGEGILNEVFGVFSGKDEEQRAGGGRAPYALRPEFTPTLARMYAAKAGSLPKPTKWFWQQNCFRAERPQRGRLREFMQWNVDFVGGEDTPEAKAAADAEVIALCIEALRALGVQPSQVKIRYSHRALTEGLLTLFGVEQQFVPSWLNLLDRIGKVDYMQYLTLASELGTSAPTARRIRRAIEQRSKNDAGDAEILKQHFERVNQRWRARIDRIEAKSKELNSLAQLYPASAGLEFARLDNEFEVLQSRFEGDKKRLDAGFTLLASAMLPGKLLKATLEKWGYGDWIVGDFKIVRGLAYYTGMVFEVHEASGAERAIAGGGRYDGLIELFGGPPTPAVGFGMGDVVLSLVLQDRGLMPEGKALLDKLSAPSPSLRPDCFLISNGQPESDAQLRPTVATLRRAGLHARHTYKATKNIGKLLQEASAQHARFAAIIENQTEATLKNLDTGQQHPDRVPLADLGARVRA